LIAAGSLSAFQQTPAQPAAGEGTAVSQNAAIPPERAILNKYCITCHNQRLKTAGLTLDRLDTGDVAADAATWEKVVKKLRSGAMPPAGAARPDKAAIATLASAIETRLDQAAATAPNPGHASVHRLNRAEYVNAVRDLLALNIDGAALLPADPVGYGFDNIGDVLSVSPALLERYMVAAGTISRLAIGDPAIRPATQSYTVPYTMWQNDRVSEDLPFGSRGGLAVQHYFPLDGEYAVRIVLQRAYQNQIRGVGEKHQVELRLDRQLIKQFTVGGDGPRGAWAAVTAPSMYEQTADADLEITLNVKAGTRLIGASFVQQATADEGVLEPRAGVTSLAYSRDRNAPMAIDRIEIKGPQNGLTPDETPSRQRIFVCSPTPSLAEQACAQKIVSALTRRAFRRPVAEADIKPLMALYNEGRAKGSFEAGIESALRGILVDPEFLFHIERDPANIAPATVYHLSDIELASRLSFFLWSSIPDEELLGLAERGTLHDAKTLDQQVARMLKDPRSSALVKNFFGQWLLLRNVRSRTPDPDAFPDFDENLRVAMQRETELFVDNEVRADHSVVNLLSANYTFLNERLARHYDIPNVYGDHFRRVTLPDDRRGGLLGQAGILMVTSYANRTSPTQRGLWVLDSLLGSPPPPPPPNVPSLPEDNSPHGKAVSMRDRMEKHRTNAICASCHSRMDPLGFALENFDAIGTWRSNEGATPIDVSGVLPDGSRFEGPAGLRTILLSHRDEFVQTVTEKLMTYALGRGVEYYDAPAVRAITREATPSDYRWSSLIAGIVKSTPFQMRRSRES
jgi:mono/diheme cytochrome c family protein